MASTSHSGINYGAQVGINYGTVTADFHLPPERAETPPSPLSTVPFARDPDFVSRHTLLNQIRDKSLVLGSRIALVGLGGVGKSQIAIEYSYQVRSQAPATWIFWVHASNATRFEQSFRDIADQVKIPRRQDPQANIFSLVEHWLRDNKRGRWLLILDNVDDDEFFRKYPVAGQGDQRNSPVNVSAKPLLEYLPRSLNGFVIITSRTREVALKMVDYKDIIEVKPMEGSEALELLERKLQQGGEREESQRLVDALEFMPLAIVQAASYIRNRAPRYSVSQYLRNFQGSDREAIRLLEKEAGHPSRDWEAKNSILVTWQMSFDYIRQRKRSAAKLLSLMSFFDRQGIPENLIRHRPKVNCTLSSDLLNDSSDGETSGSDIGPDFEDDIATLRAFSFISVSENSTFFTMHRLVQLTMRAWLKSRGQMDELREMFIGTLSREFPTGRYENWEKCRLLFPHVRSAMSQRPKSREALLKWAILLHRGARYASESGNIADTRNMALKSREQRLKLLGVEDVETLASTEMLARAYALEGRWKEAEQFTMQVIETRKTKLSIDHPDTLSSMADLILILTNQSRWEEAEQLGVQALKTSKTKLGIDHPSTLRGMANLASTYERQRRYEEAEHLLMQIIEIRKTKLSVDHPDTLSSMSNLATVYSNRGRWEKAEQLLLQVIETSKRKLGVDHPSTLLCMANLASTFWHQNRWEEAEQLFVQVIEARKRKIGVDHPDTLMSIVNLAWTWKSLGKDTEAIALLRDCLSRQKQIIGSNHRQTNSTSEILLLWEQHGLNMEVR